MAAASDKARFYLEQYVPELKEYEAKEIFSRDEIASITSKRSDFEHILNARGSTPADYARYATYEMNLDALRKKRCKRKGVKITSFSGQRTVFFILDRATKKFPGDMGLWMQYITFCKKEKANKKLAKVFTSVLRLHPNDCSLWILAAKHYAETQGDIGTARNYMQRGLRFCKRERKMWLEYAKLEMAYLFKIAARRKILGLDEKGAQKADEDENMIALPSVTAADFESPSDGEDAKKGVQEGNQDLLKRLENAPVFTGGIPIAIFDAAMKEFGTKATEVAEDFFDLILRFETVPSAPTILDHILSWLREHAPKSVELIVCEARYDMFNIDQESADFPPALSKSLARLKSGSTTLTDRQKVVLTDRVVYMFMPLLLTHNDEDIRKVLEATLRRYLVATSQIPYKPGGKETTPAAIAAAMQSRNSHHQADIVLHLATGAALG